MELESGQIYELAESIWTSMLGLSLTPIESGTIQEFNAGIYIGCIQITGGWQGALTFQCTDNLARTATSIMFDMPIEETDADLVQDAVGELTNMLGGNLKSLLPGSSSLSMPAVAMGTAFTLGVSRSQVVRQVGLDCDGEPVLITVHCEA